MTQQKIPEYDPTRIEEKWLERWLDEKIYLAEPRPDQKKFFIHFAYPGVSGYLHVGHLRGFTYADIISRHKLMNGYSVLFPAGFHASGLPAIGLAKHVARKDPDTIEYLRSNGCPEEIINTLHDPQEVVKYFSKMYTDEYWKKFGYLIDYSRIMDTISPGYKKFIQWQFRKLHEKDLLIQKPHFAPFCPVCGPVAVDASETDVKQGGTAQALEFAVLKFFMKDGSILPAATLRPETIFGVTNMWLHPQVEYQKVKMDDDSTWILSPEAAVKIQHQKDNVEIIGTVFGKELIGQTCRVPYTNAEVLILPGDFVKPEIATGVVMSVPAHAPYDWAALVDIQKDAENIVKEYGIPASELRSIKAIQLISTGKEKTDNPAGEICDEMGIVSQKEDEKLEEATETIYKREFHSGTLMSLCGEYAGLKISEVKDTLQRDLIDMGLADIFHEFSERVICRSGDDVIIKKIPDQWFIRYSDKSLTDTSKAHAEKMNIYPDSYYKEMPSVLDWFTDRACIRQGSWLGSEFPFKEDWIIEPISDSTIYPAYYIISKYINTGELLAENITDELFDYIFNAVDNDGGDFANVTREFADRLKREFDYWYPVDINLGGKEHKTVHFPVYVMNHVAIMPEKNWPRGIFVNWWVTQTKGDKISKSKGGAEPIPDAASKYSVDAMRLYYSHVASSDLDFEWDNTGVLTYRSRLNRTWEMFHKLRNIDSEKDESINNWLLSKLMNRIKSVKDAFDNYDLRNAANEIFFGIFSDCQWYIRRGGCSKKTLDMFLDHWVRLMSPFTPFFTEELWENLGHDKLVTLDSYPDFEEQYIDSSIEFAEGYLKNNVDDIKEIMKVTKITPKKIVIYTSPEWKYEMLGKILKEFKNGAKPKPNDVLKALMADPGTREKGKDAVTFINKFAADLSKMGEADRNNFGIELDEHTFLNSCKDFLEAEFSSTVEIYSADSDDRYDPQKKSRAAVPLRPAIFVE